MEKSKTKYEILHDQRRKQIMDTTKKLVLSSNISSVTMSDIASACNISRQTLYKYFSSFDEVIYAIQSEIIQNFPVIPETDFYHFMDALADLLFHFSREHAEDFLFISMFDIYARTHKTEQDLHRYYRTIIRDRISHLRKTTEHMPQTINGYPAEEVFSVAAHAIWGFVTRLAVLGDSYYDTSHVTEEKSLEILKNMVASYLNRQG